MQGIILELGERDRRLITGKKNQVQVGSAGVRALIHTVFCLCETQDVHILQLIYLQMDTQPGKMQV